MTFTRGTNVFSMNSNNRNGSAHDVCECGSSFYLVSSMRRENDRESKIETKINSVDDNWASKGKLGVALFSTDVGTYQMIIYQTKNQVLTSINLKKDSKFEVNRRTFVAWTLRTKIRGTSFRLRRTTIFCSKMISARTGRSCSRKKSCWSIFSVKFVNRRDDFDVK